MNGRTVGVCFGVILIILWAAPASAIDLESRGGFLFDVVDTGGGELSNGSIDAYDGCYFLEVNGRNYHAGAPGTLEGRTIRMAKMSMGELAVSRSVTVPDEEGRDYARYVDVIENNGSSPVTVTVRYRGNLGSDSWTRVWATSSGDDVVDAEDLWFGTDDEDGSGDPSLAHVFYGSGAAVTPTQVSLSGDNIEARFTVEIASRRAAAFMIFAFQGPNQQTVRDQVEVLMGNIRGATADLAPGVFDLLANWSPYGSIGLANVYVPEGVEGVERRPRIYRGELRLAVRDVRERMARAVDVAERLGGHLMEQAARQVILRVPVERFDDALEQLEALGDVLDRQVEIERGNEQVRDLQTRLQTARDVLARLTAMHERAATTTDALVIQREIERINLIIETIEAEIRDLEQRQRFSTITCRFEPLIEYEPIPNDLFRLPFLWLDELGLDNLLNFN